MEESRARVLETVPCTRRERKEVEELEKFRRLGMKIGRWFGRRPVGEEQDDEPHHNGYTICGGASSKDEAESTNKPRTRFVYGQQAKDEPEEVEDVYAKSRNMVLGYLAILVIFVVAVALIGASLRGGQVVKNEPTTSTASSGGSPAVMTAGEEDEFVIDMPRRDGNRLNADGVKVEDDAEAFRAQIAEQAMHDPLTLWVYYNFSPLGLIDPIENPAELCKDGRIEDGNIYSEEGEKRYNDWLVLWNVADIASVSEIKFQSANTGVVGTQVTQSPGVAGVDKAGYDIAYEDAQGNTVGEHSALERCTQPTGGRPGIPTGPTDNDLQPKSSNPDDYKQPGDGDERDSGTGSRPKSTVTTPAETTPPDVVTSLPGGGGVVDTPTNPPGSESGVTAPGVTEPVEESVPEPEEGVNPTDGSANTGDPGLPVGF
ncbi:MAG: hypothetical protein WBI29_02255 [Candidatus Saccharimonadales bacterium]